MIRLLTLLLIPSFSLSVWSQQTQFDWAEKCGNPPNTTDTRTCMASGADGVFIMAGEFLAEAVFGDETLVSAGGTDVFVIRYTQAGDVSSATRLGAADYEFVQDVKTDDEGNIFVLGYFYGTTQIGSSQYTSYGSQDLFVARIDNSGKTSWSHQIGGIMADYPAGLALDDDGNITVAGYFYDEIMVGDTSLVSLAGSDIFLARYEMNGQLVGVFHAGGTSSDQVRSISVGPDASLIIAGSFYNDFTLGDTTFTTDDPVGVFVARLSPGLDPSWAFQLDGSYLNTEVYAVSAHNGNFYLGGNFSEDIHFGGQTFSAGEFNQDVYLAKYDGSGDLLWARHGHGWGSDQVVGLEVDHLNNVYLTGHYLDTLHFEQVTIPYTLCCGSREVFIINYTHDGHPWWSEQISGTRTALHSLTVNSEDRLLLSGQFTEEVTFGIWTLSSLEGFKNFVTCLTGDMFTAIPQPVSRTFLNAYPNPTRNILYLGHEGNIARAEVLDMSGVLVMSAEGRNIRQLDMQSLTPGAYFIRVITDKGQIAVEKVVLVD